MFHPLKHYPLSVEALYPLRPLIKIPLQIFLLLQSYHQLQKDIQLLQQEAPLLNHLPLQLMFHLQKHYPLCVEALYHLQPLLEFPLQCFHLLLSFHRYQLLQQEALLLNHLPLQLMFLPLIHHPLSEVIQYHPQPLLRIPPLHGLDEVYKLH